MLTAGSKVGGRAGRRAREAARPCQQPASPSAVTLYNCSFGRSDCSLCLAADPAYRCVWCSGQSRCVYEALCSNATSECPPPVVTRVSPLPPHLQESSGPAGLGPPGQPGSANFRSSLRPAHWAEASASPSLGQTWGSEQTM